MIPGNPDRLDVLRADEFAGSARREILWIDGDPDGLESARQGEGVDQATAARGATTAPAFPVEGEFEVARDSAILRFWRSIQGQAAMDTVSVMTIYLGHEAQGAFWLVKGFPATRTRNPAEAISPDYENQTQPETDGGDAGKEGQRIGMIR